MTNRTVKITETPTGQTFYDDDGYMTGSQELTKFEAAWPSGKTFTKFVNRNDDVNERRRQEEFAESKGYRVEWLKPVYTRKKRA